MAPNTMKKGAAQYTLVMKFSPTIKTPIAMPSGMTLVAWSRRMRTEATMAPAAVPIATTPTSDEACVVE